MAKVFTQEEREKIKGQVVELVRQNGRETLRQLEAKTGATRYLMSVLARELVAVAMYITPATGYFPLNRLVRTGKTPAKNSQGQR